MRASLALVAAILVAGCAELPTRPAGPDAARPSLEVAESLGSEFPGTQLLGCPSQETRSARASIGPSGGSVSVAGSSITVPPGAVLDETPFEIVIPASPLMEVEIHAVGQASYAFRKAATITIDFSRCAGSLPPDLGVFGVYIDESSKKILERMGGDAQAASLKVTFQTDHLSGYAVAY